MGRKVEQAMKIAQIAPVFEAVPPKYYGGTERVVYYLTEELVKMGHEVTLFASGDSITNGILEPQCPCSLRLNDSCLDNTAYSILLQEKLYQKAAEFDIIHSHVDYFLYPVIRRIPTRVLTTLHGRLDIPHLVPIYAEFSDVPLVSISNNQRAPFPHLNWQGTVYHGIPNNLYTFNEKPDDYLAFIGRTSPEKRLDSAIEIAKRVGMKIKIAAKVDKADYEYFSTIIKPLLKCSLVEYIGEIGEQEKNNFLGAACALLFPIDWPEPFGLVMIEALACGTPVIARLSGSVLEIIDNGKNGFVFSTIGEAVKAIRKITSISRFNCHKSFEKKFTARQMATEYLQLYSRLL